MKDIRIGFVGVGQIGKNHLETYLKVPGAKVVAACDIDAPELARVAEKYQIPWTTPDFRELIKRDDIDAVDVCLHNNLHAPVTIAALEAGKHVYCEKPMAGTYVDAKAMLDTARRCHKHLHIQLATLYTKEAKLAKRLIEAGKLGKVFHARSAGFRRRGRPFVDGYGTFNFVNKSISAGGALYDMGVYHISQMLWLLDRPKVLRITGKTYAEMAMHEGRRAESGFNVEELGLGFVRFDGGLTMDIIEAWAIHMGGLESSCIVGSQGGIRIDPFAYHTAVEDAEVNMSFDLTQVDTRWHKTDPTLACYDSSQHHWVAALQGQVPLLRTAEIALDTMLISEGIYLSDRLEREVSVEEVLENSKSTALKL